MRYEIVWKGSLGILLSYLIFMLPIATATNINIVFNGVTQETITYDQSSLINKKIAIKHYPEDITWTNVKISVNIDAASLSHSIKKIYLFKCNGLSPTECIYSSPQVFDQWVDTELSWRDISQKEGPGLYPQVSNLMFLIKLEDINGRTSWTGFWTTIRRTNYNVFSIYSYQINEIDIYAKSIQFIQPIKTYIENKLMIPFRWIEKVIFKGSSKLYALGASEDEIDQSSPVFQTATPSGFEVNAINRDYYFVFPETSSGIANPITLNLNPTFTCGDGICESDLGETEETCCYDCGCSGGRYCNADPEDPSKGSCEDPNSIFLKVLKVDAEKVRDCSEPFTTKITLKVENPPQSLAESITGSLEIDSKTYPLTCEGGPVYECETSLKLSTLCGSGAVSFGEGKIKATLTYYNGPNQITQDFETTFSGFSVNYDCSCEEGYYCDIGTHTCESEDAITLGITSLTSYLDNYTPGDKIRLTAKIFNPPTGLVLIDASANLTLEEGRVSPGTPQCSGPNEEYEYTCEIPFEIVGYSKENSYTFDPNYLTFTVTYNDGPVAKTKKLTTTFGPISIPSQFCGDGNCNMGETSETCCRDCGCGGENEYCDLIKGCQSLDDITLSVQSVNPQTFEDCREEHVTILRAKINNVPSQTTLDEYEYLRSGLVSNWPLECESLNVEGEYQCSLTIPELESEGCKLPAYVIDNNMLRFIITFPDGDNPAQTKTLEAGFPDIRVIPVYHCGDGICESDLGENASNCCYDCPCWEDPSYGEEYYCEYNEKTYEGSCMPKNQIRLVADSPKAPVYFDNCEITNDVNVKLHIENAPSTLQLEHEYAVINNTNAEFFYCEEVSTYTYNCTLSIPPISECTKGRSYTFSPNKIYFFVTYENGPEKKETMTISADLPKIIIHQKIRTLYDITQDTIHEMQSRLHRTIDIARNLFKWYKNCMEIAKLVAYMTILTAMFFGMYGGYYSFKKIEDPIFKMKWDISKTGKAVRDIGLTGTSFLTAWTAYCKYITKMYELDMKIQELETEMIKMERCIEMAQHNLDTGRCKGNEESCFNDMIECVDFERVEDWTSDIDEIMDDAREEAGKITREFSDIASTWEEFPEETKADVIIYWGPKGNPNKYRLDDFGGYICSTAGREDTHCIPTYVKFVARNVRGCSKNNLMLFNEQTAQVLEKNRVVRWNSVFTVGENRLVLFCDRNENKKYDSNEKEIASLKVIVKENNKADCLCGLIPVNTITITSSPQRILSGQTTKIEGNVPSDYRDIKIDIQYFEDSVCTESCGESESYSLSNHQVTVSETPTGITQWSLTWTPKVEEKCKGAKITAWYKPSGSSHYVRGQTTKCLTVVHGASV